MSNETTNLKLTKQLETENYDINIFNDNFDKIDEAVGNNASQLKDCAKKDGTLQTGLNAEKINGYVSSKIFKNSDIIIKEDFNNFTEVGLYKFGDVLQIPNAPPIDWGILQVLNIDGYIYQEATTVTTSRGGNYTTYKRTRKENNEWNEWQQLATTEETAIICSPSVGYSIIAQNNVKINNIIYYNIVVEKTDKTAFPINAYCKVATTIQGVKTSGSCMGMIDSNIPSGVGSSFFNDNGDIFLTIITANVNLCIVSGVVVL